MDFEGGSQQRNDRKKTKKIVPVRNNL